MTASDSLENLEDDGLLHANGIDALTGMPAARRSRRARRSGRTLPRLGIREVGRLSKIWSAFTKKLHGLPEDLEEQGQRPGRRSAGPSCSRPTRRPRFARPSSP